MKKTEFDPEMLAEFIAESLEGIEEIPSLIISLEENPRDETIINTIFRPIHSLKGNAAYFGFLKIKGLAHVLETLLDNMRSRRIVANPNIISILIAGTDEIKLMLNRVQAGKQEIEDEKEYEELVQTVLSAGENSQSQLESHWEAINELIQSLCAASEASNCDCSTDIAQLKDLIQKVHPVKKKQIQKVGSSSLPEPVSKLCDLVATTFDRYMPDNTSEEIFLLLKQIEDLADDENSIARIRKMIDDYETMISTVGFDNLLKEILTESLEKLIAEGSWKESEQKNKQITDSSGKQKETAAAPAPVSPKTLRISEDNIDSFLAYVGELIVVREMFEYLRKRLATSGADHSILTEFRHVNESFNSLSQDLQNSIMSIRKVSVKGITQKIPRIVRDIAVVKEKKIHTEIFGEELQIDKSLLETLEAPLIHMVRNAADHGIEPPSIREKNNKSPEGLVTVSFREDAENVVLAVKDDGGGLNMDALKQKAVSMGFAKESDNLTEKNIIDLLFMSGVSTAEKITDISGRGVGMDVVKQNIEQAGGVISVQTHAQRGSEFKIVLPKAVGTQIIMGMILAVGEQEYVIGLERVMETFDLISEDVTDVAGRGLCVKRRGRLLPLVNLDEYFELKTDAHGRKKIVVAIKSKNKETGLIVDEVRTIQQVVLKDIIGLSQSRQLFSGAAVTGSGKVAMVIDIERLNPSEELCEK